MPYFPLSTRIYPNRRSSPSRLSKYLLSSASKVTPELVQELGSLLSIRFEGICIKHCTGSSSVKIHDKFKRVLRTDTTANDVSFIKNYRKVEYRNGSITRELPPLKKSIYSIIDLREIPLGCNSRYLEFLSSLDDYSDGLRALKTDPTQNRSWHSGSRLQFLRLDRTKFVTRHSTTRIQHSWPAPRRSEETSSACFKRKSLPLSQTAAHPWAD